MRLVKVTRKNKVIYNYYQEELSKLVESGPKHVTLGDDFPNKTDFLNLNIESIPVLIEFLTKELTRLQSLDTKD